jgi:hypothetical protein
MIMKRMTLRMTSIANGFARLGARMICACAAALIAAVLIFSAPEVGMIGAIGGVVMGGISAVLVRPHA